MANREYFRIIETDYPKIGEVKLYHEQKLNNYIKYKSALKDEELMSMMSVEDWDKYVPDFDIHHMNTSMCERGGFFYMVTVLCCEDKEEENEEKGDY